MFHVSTLSHWTIRACERFECPSRFKVTEEALIFTFPNSLRIWLRNSVLTFLTYDSFSVIFRNDMATHRIQQQNGFWVSHHQHVLTMLQRQADHETLTDLASPWKCLEYKKLKHSFHLQKGTWSHYSWGSTTKNKDFLPMLKWNMVLDCFGTFND